MNNATEIKCTSLFAPPENQYENSSISSIDNGIAVTKFSSLPSNPSGTVATTKQQRSLTATMHHPSAATHSWHWQLCLLDRVNKLEVAVPPGNWSQVQTNGQYFAPELFIPTDAVKTAGGQWALRKCTAGLWIAPNGRICDRGEKCEEQASRCNLLQGEDIFL